MQPPLTNCGSRSPGVADIGGWVVVRRQVVKFFADEPLRQQLDAPQALAALASLAIIVASSTGLPV